MSAPRQGADIRGTSATFMKCAKHAKIFYKMKVIINFNVSCIFQSIRTWFLHSRNGFCCHYGIVFFFFKSPKLLGAESMKFSCHGCYYYWILINQTESIRQSYQPTVTQSRNNSGKLLSILLKFLATLR